MIRLFSARTSTLDGLQIAADVAVNASRCSLYRPTEVRLAKIRNVLSVSVATRVRPLIGTYHATRVLPLD